MTARHNHTPPGMFKKKTISYIVSKIKVITRLNKIYSTANKYFA